MPIKIKAKSYIVDASVAVKWFSIEEGSVDSRKLLLRGETGNIKLFAPDLLLYEVGNALLKGKRLGADAIIEVFSVLFGSSLELVKLDQAVAQQAAVFAEQYNLTFYDASYAGCAYVLGMPLLSFNAKDHKKIKEISVREPGKL